MALFDLFFFSEEGFEGVRKSDVVNWYLKEMEEEIENEEQLLETKAKVEKVIDRLTQRVSSPRRPPLRPQAHSFY